MSIPDLSRGQYENNLTYPKSPSHNRTIFSSRPLGRYVVCSGQIALLPNGDDSLLNEDVAIQCRQALENMEPY